jgi:hypothetical protein
MVQSIGKCVVVHIILLSQSSWYTLVMTSYKKNLPVAKFRLTQKNVDTEEQAYIHVSSGIQTHNSYSHSSQLIAKFI